LQHCLEKSITCKRFILSLLSNKMGHTSIGCSGIYIIVDPKLQNNKMIWLNGKIGIFLLTVNQLYWYEDMVRSLMKLDLKSSKNLNWIFMLMTFILFGNGFITPEMKQKNISSWWIICSVWMQHLVIIIFDKFCKSYIKRAWKRPKRRTDSINNDNNS